MNKNVRVYGLVTLLLLITLVQSSVPAGLATAQSPQRERRATAAPIVTPSPTPSPSPSQTPSPSASPSPSPSSSGAAKTSTATQSVADLQARIQEILRKPQLAPAMIGIKVASLETGKILFEENSHKLLRPASNMKLYTVAAALDRLSPDYRFSTSIYAPAKPDAGGLIRGDLTLYGRGDPSIAARFNNGDYFKAINDLAARVVAAGVKRVEGDLVGDETYFIGPQYGSGWEWEDLQWWYGAEVSSLTSNDNALDLSVKPGAQVGAAAIVTTGPPDPLLTIVNRAKTSPKGTRRDLSIHRGLNSDEIEISGTIAIDDRGYTGGLGISRPGLLFAYLLRAALSQQGVIITGRTRTTGPLTSEASVNSAPAVTSLVEVASLQSPPLSLIAAQTMKPSQNLYTELLLRTLGKNAPPSTNPVRADQTSESAGLEVLKAFLREAGVNPTSLALSDGSGLSRNDMITPEATLQLLIYMRKHRYATAFRDSLPIAGVDGTLRNRMKGTPAENNLRAKTGTLSSASSLSGYVTSAAGEELVFSIMVNNYPPDTGPVSLVIDPIAVLLASFTGRS
ncbi:MAG TPA: D-alanyl-D-alanine carboxypeptidase/D-alanyl-D-alanine-endopeptidase [Pyrinomonadaceae bacterium]|nr:D-alanyl-D-alanine carboxypeptidase/D-alanyl-D-alanine-endopeptidase [Pyrinomonadaceae bacterium]